MSDNFDYRGLGKAISAIYFWGKKVGRMGGDLKEKYQSVRWYISPSAPYKLYNITHPGYYGYFWAANHKPVMHTIDNISISYMRIFGPLMYMWKRFFYAYAYKKAIEASPHLSYEILICCDEPKLLFKRERNAYNALRNNCDDE